MHKRYIESLLLHETFLGNVSVISKTGSGFQKASEHI